MTNVELFRPKPNLVFAGIGIVLSAFFTWSSFYQGGAIREISSTLFALFICDCIYIFLIRPKVTFCDEGIIITNPFEDISIGWSDVLDLDARWALVVQTEKFTVNAWAATAPGRHSSKNVHISEVKNLGIDFGGSIRPAESPRADSGVAIYRAKIRLKKFRLSNTPDSLQTVRKRQWKASTLASVFLILAVVVNIFGH